LPGFREVVLKLALILCSKLFEFLKHEGIADTRAVGDRIFPDCNAPARALGRLSERFQETGESNLFS